MMAKRTIGMWMFILSTLCASLTWAMEGEPLPLEPMLTPPPADGPVVVRVGFDLQDVHAIDEESETFCISGMLTLRWKDSRLAFDPEKAGCAEKIYNGTFQFNKVSPSWFPQLMPINTAGHTRATGYCCGWRRTAVASRRR